MKKENNSLNDRLTELERNFGLKKASSQKEVETIKL